MRRSSSGGEGRLVSVELQEWLPRPLPGSVLSLSVDSSAEKTQMMIVAMLILDNSEALISQY